MTCPDRRCPPCGWCVERDCTPADRMENGALHIRVKELSRMVDAGLE